jgi:hypothetical protein
MKIVLVAVALLACAGTVAAEQFYKWKDSSGTWHYTTTPPPDGAQSAELTVDPNARSSQPEAVAAPASGADEAVPADAVAKRRMACDKSRAHLQTLTENPFVRMDRDGDGELEMLTEAQQAEEVKRTAALVEGFCDPS